MRGGARGLECLLRRRKEDVTAAGGCYRARRAHAALRMCKFHVSHAAQHCLVVQRKASVAAAAATKDEGRLISRTSEPSRSEASAFRTPAKSKPDAFNHMREQRAELVAVAQAPCGQKDAYIGIIRLGAFSLQSRISTLPATTSTGAIFARG
eukprot:s473_g3.t1